MRDQGLDLDHLTACGLRRDIDERACHHLLSSVQAAMVTMTSTLSDQNEPSESSAIAITLCVSASRMRVEMLARPARGPRWNVTMLGSGFFSLRMCRRLT